MTTPWDDLTANLKDVVLDVAWLSLLLIGAPLMFILTMRPMPTNFRTNGRQASFIKMVLWKQMGVALKSRLLYLATDGGATLQGPAHAK